MYKELRFKTNAGRKWAELRNPLKIIFNSYVIKYLRDMPPIELKNSIYRALLGMRIGKDVAICPDVVLDPFFPELIEIGDSAFIGVGAKIFVHEFWPDRATIKPVKIGEKAFIGGYSVIRHGVELSEGVFIASNSFVNKSIKKKGVYGGVPAKLIRRKL